MMDDVSGWTWVWMSVMMAVFWGGLILSGVWALRSFTGGRPPLEIARERYARGEISREQFEEIQHGLLPGTGR